MGSGALVAAAVVIFAAELGDKSQLATMAFATRHAAGTVLVAITVAALLVHGAAAGIGAALGAALPRDLLTVVAAVIFLVFGVLELRRDGHDPAPEGDPGAAGPVVTTPRRARIATIATIVATVSFAELGDKTQLATVNLAATNGALPTWLGASAGMVAADGLAIVVGRFLRGRLPERPLRLLAAGAYLVLGAVLLISVIA